MFGFGYGRSFSLGRIGSAADSFRGILDRYPGAVAGFSVFKLTKTATNSIRVRRTSDDAELDIGFDANGDLDSTALLAFVNKDYNAYTSDFSSTEDLFESNGTGAAAQSVGGVDDAYKFTTITGTGQMYASVAPFSGKGGGNNFRIQADVYLPSTNAEIDKVRIWTGYGSEGFIEVTATDTWTSINQTLDVVSGGQLRFQAYDGNDLTPTTTQANVFYLKNIVVTQTTADGAVTTWYDQSGNGNDATNSTESEQPLVVSGGTLVEENGKAALDFDGVNDHLDVGITLTSGFHTFYLHQSTKTSGFEYLFYNAADQIRLYDYLWRPFINSVNYPSGMPNDGFDARYLWEFARDDSANIRNYRNGSQDAFSSGVPIAGVDGAPFTIDSIGAISNTIQGSVQEIIIFNSDQSTNRTGIEENINSRFNIYT